MAVVDLDLVELHRSLVVFYRALLLQHELFLVIHDLLCNGVACPRCTVAFKVHPCLGEQILVSLQGPLRLQERCAVRAGIDVDQRIAFTYPLTLLVLHGDDEAVHLTGNQIGIGRGDRADCVKVDADVAFSSRRARNGDPRRAAAQQRRCFLSLLVVV